MEYRRCGRSGLKLPAISLGLWHNFGGDRPLETSRAILRRAFDLGVTHFDLANNYGPPYGSAEVTFGRVLASDLRPYRDELVISTKAGYDMWPGPYGEWGSRKYLLASLDQSLARMGLDYVDIFYSHRFDPDTPLEETMGALDTAVRSGKALYAGISSYSPEKTREAYAILERARHAAAHPPAVVLAAEPLDRAGAARHARRARRRLHRLLAARAGDAHDEVPRRDPGGLARGREHVALARPADRPDAREDPRAERDRSRPRPVARADGTRLDAARPADDLDADRRVERRAARGLARRARQRSSSRTTSWRRSTATRPTATSTSGRARQRARTISNCFSRSSPPRRSSAPHRDVALGDVHVVAAPCRARAARPPRPRRAPRAGTRSRRGRASRRRRPRCARSPAGSDASSRCHGRPVCPSGDWLGALAPRPRGASTRHTSSTRVFSKPS